jgi:two-component system response regulator YesN
MYSVLIVDDEPMIRQGLEKLIRQSNLSISVIRNAQNGEEALEMIEKERPDFLFTDIRMPKMDGLELCKRVSEQNPQIQVAVISGYGEFEYARQCVAYEVKEYILKPISLRKVKETLEKLILNKQRVSSSSYSPSKMEGLVEKSETAIWELNVQKLEEILAEWKAEYTRWHLNNIKKHELLQEFYEILVKRLKAREVIPTKEVLQIGNEVSLEEAFSIFRAHIQLIMDNLVQFRSGNFMDPINEAKKVLDDHLAADVSLDYIAKKIGLNSSYLSFLFKQSTGETFIQYRIRKRMERAKQLLAIPHYRITEVSYEIGYADHPHFTKTFKKITGQTPSEYREMLGIK